MTKITDKGRNQLLATVGTAMAASMMVTSAYAAETVVTPVLPGPLTVDTNVNGHDIIDAVLDNVATINATISGTSGGVGVEETSTTTSSVSVDGNDILGTAIGNNFDNEIDLSVLENDIVSDGAAALGFETNTGAITTTIENNDVFVSIPDFQTGSVAVTGNDIEGRATGNAGSTNLEGLVPNTYSSGIAGSSVLASGAIVGDWLNADGSVVASTVQINANPDIESNVIDNNIYLELISTGDNTVTAAPTVDSNTIAANAKGNSSNSTIGIEAGGSPDFTGSLVLTNAQSNADVLGNGLIEADNLDSEIYGEIEANLLLDINTLNGSLAVEGNAITATASGNDALGANGVAGNRILIADGMSFQGNAVTASSVSAYNSGVVSDVVTADVVISSSQGNVGASNGNRMVIEAEVDDGNIYGDVESLDTGSVTVADNDVSATARGNAASSSFATGDGSAYFNGTVAVSNQQTNLYTNVQAYNDVPDISADVAYSDGAVLEDSTVSVDGNSTSASAYGNLVSQSVALEATATNLPDDRVNLTGGTGPDGNVSAQGNVVVTNLQSQYSANVLADLDDSEIYADSDAVLTVDSSISVTDNTQEAIAIGNSASNGLSLSGTTVDTGAGISSVQIVADASSVTAVGSAHAYTQTDDVSGSTVETSGNLQRSIAYGGSAGNTLAVDAETITVSSDVADVASTITVNSAATDGFALDFTNAPAVAAAYGVLNVQSVSAAISAEANGGDGSSSAYSDINGDVVAGSSVITDGNSIVGAAYGTDANNQASLDVGNLTATPATIPLEPDFATVMNVTNAQTVTELASVYAEASGSETFESYIGGSVDQSSVSTSENTAQAVAYGNRASNGVTVTATNIDTEADSFPAGTRGTAQVVGAVISTDASFSVNSAQFAGGAITATVLDDVVTPDTSAEVYTYVDLDVTSSSIVSNGNVLTAGATGNRADNLVDLSGNTLATTSALTNFQQSEADIQALIGIEGGPATPAVAPAIGGTTSDIGQATGTMDYNSISNILDVSGSPVTMTFTGHNFTAAEVAYLNSLSYVSGATLGGNSITIAVGSHLVYPDFNGFSFSTGTPSAGDETMSFIGFTAPNVAGAAASPGTPNVGGVTVAIGDDVSASTVSVNANSTAGSVTGNSAVNSVAVDGTSVPDGSDHFQTTATADGLDTVASGDHMLTNVQVTGDSELTSTVYGTFAIDMTEGADITDSTLTVDGNSQSSRAVANTASNSVELDATNTDAGAVLASNQASEAAVSALSNVDIFAPVSSDNTSVSMSDNSNLAVAVVNNVSNSLTIDGTNVYPNFTSRDVLLDVDTNVYGSGDGILLNQQVAQTSATATAVTTIYNEDGTYLATDGVVDGTVKITGNSTTAEASANRAVNVANVSAGASLGASVGIVNAQNSSATVASNATTNAGVVIAGDDTLNTAALNGSSVTLGTNSTSSLARGNSATNALNYSAGANYGDIDLLAGTGAYTNTTAGNVSTSARAAVLNVQGNSGAVSATSTQATYVVALNSNAADPSITNATVGVIGNSVAAAAYGNTATNSVTVAALNTNMPTVAVGNVQNNTGPVSATVTTVSYGVSGGYGAIAGSALSVTNNAVTATAVGNNAVNAIIGN